MSDSAPPSSPASPATPASPAAPRRRPWRITTAVLVVAALAAAWRWWPRATESTDDAFVEGRIVAVAPTVPGRVARVLVEDNQHVEAGQALVELDPAPYQARADEARAALAVAETSRDAAHEFAEMTRVNVTSTKSQAEAAVASAQATLEQNRAEARAATAEAERAQADLERFRGLSAGVVSPQDRERVEKTAAAALAQADAATRKIGVGEASVAEARARLAGTASGDHQLAAAEAGLKRMEADVERCRATVRETEIALDDCRVSAPLAGTVTRKAIEAGAYAQAGQSLLALVGDELWVVANLKEGQLRDLAVGQHATIHIDAYPQASFAAHVDSIQAGSGARFSLLPPENATGNFVKVVQRVPVKLVFDERPDPKRFHLGPGMSAQPTITVR